MQRLRIDNFQKGVAVAGLVALVLSIGIYAAGARINTSKSIPIGLYWTTSGVIEKGVYVMVCPPKAGVFDEAKERGYIGVGWCPGGYGYMMKRVLATKGDSISVDDDGVRVNGKLVPLSAPLPVDGTGRPLPRYRVRKYTLGVEELLLMSDVSAKSFDGRYYGPVNRAQVRDVIRPVITW